MQTPDLKQEIDSRKIRAKKFAKMSYNPDLKGQTYNNNKQINKSD